MQSRCNTAEIPEGSEPLPRNLSLRDVLGTYWTSGSKSLGASRSNSGLQLTCSKHSQIHGGTVLLTAIVPPTSGVSTRSDQTNGTDC